MARAIGIDPGEARFGLALSDELGMLAHPLETVPAATALDRVMHIVAERGVTVAVVGVARNMDGTYGPSAGKGRNFAAQLREKTACRVIEWDERLSTVQAGRALREAGREARKQKGVIDQAAAQIILQAWLDSTASAAP